MVCVCVVLDLCSPERLPASFCESSLGASQIKATAIHVQRREHRPALCVGIVCLRLRAQERTGAVRTDDSPGAGGSRVSAVKDTSSAISAGAAVPTGAGSSEAAELVSGAAAGEPNTAGRRHNMARLPAHLIADVVSMLTMAPFDAGGEARQLEAMEAELTAEVPRVQAR